MQNVLLAVQRLVRDDVSPKHSFSKSADDLLGAGARQAALPVFQRCASAEGSAGWVTHEELLAHRHSKRRQRCLLNLPKLTSSFDLDEDASFSSSSSSPVNKDDTYHGADDTYHAALSSDAASAASSRPSSSAFNRLSSTGMGRGPSVVLG
ncbi:hypothetical protein T484DRAFT_1888665 [Baffinella frigidus]|nr:hypothetical protein T484DRAFT_1888665 [Cryptophyta sp. CCMP2293]